MLTQAKIKPDNSENVADIDTNILPERLFLMIWQSQQRADSCLPWRLGLDEQTFAIMSHNYLPVSGCSSVVNEHGHLRQVLLDLRQDEWQDLCQLLIQGRSRQDNAEIWLAAIIAAACLGANHLWRDMGLPNRTMLSALLKHYFPVLADKNIHNMRWKKFFYKQLCEAEGGYVCRSPTCEQCALYADCFGTED